jgi:hypothetical protein
LEGQGGDFDFGDFDLGGFDLRILPMTLSTEIQKPHPVAQNATRMGHPFSLSNHAP